MGFGIDVHKMIDGNNEWNTAVAKRFHHTIRHDYGESPLCTTCNKAGWYNLDKPCERPATPVG